MGTVFRHIADEVLRPKKGYRRTCQVCARTGVDVYPASGNIALPDGSEGADCAVACAECLLGGRVEPTCAFQVDEVIRSYLDRQFKDHTGLFRLRRAAELAAAYRQTPDIPLFLQNNDWPLCCGDLTEFFGSPRNKRELIRLSRTAVYWKKKVRENDVDFADTGPPESYDEVSMFRCPSCAKVYWTWQFT
jgi:hypothetical protein